jgi:hypothetical protein
LAHRCRRGASTPSEPATLLTRLLERRFGTPLPNWAQGRIAGADTEALEEWGLRVLDVTNLEDILA